MIYHAKYNLSSSRPALTRDRGEQDQAGQGRRADKLGARAKPSTHRFAEPPVQLRQLVDHG